MFYIVIKHKIKINFGPIGSSGTIFLWILSFIHFENDQSLIYLIVDIDALDFHDLIGEKNKIKKAFSPIGWAVQ